MKNYLTDNTVGKTFRAGSTLGEANIMKETKQCTCKDSDDFVFMDMLLEVLCQPRINSHLFLPSQLISIVIGIPLDSNSNFKNLKKREKD